MAKRLILWILFTMMSLQGSFAASVLHCPPSFHNSSLSPSARHQFRHEIAATTMNVGTASMSAGHLMRAVEVASDVSASVGPKHAGQHAVNHKHKLPCCDSTSDRPPVVTFSFPPSIKVPPSTSASHSLPNVFLENPKRPPKSFSV